MFNKILIANRSEIASRIIRTCHQEGIQTLAIFTPADRHLPFVKEADQSVNLGANDISQSYLNADLIFEIAQKYGADAIHPGFGFFAENAEFAQTCKDKGIVFIGPEPESITQMASKKAARQMMTDAKIPVIPGFEGAITDFASEAKNIGYPVLIKASAGGGGRGMRQVETEANLENAIKSAQSEAQKAFGEGTLLLEKYLYPVRHIEVQIIGDGQGNVWHLFERECSLQRRYQKVVEEAPAPHLKQETREHLYQLAVQIGQLLNYKSLGTVEFAVDAEENVYFLEVNTRIQVEHPVTEAITGLDLVSLQLQVALGETLGLKQAEIVPQGHAIECRVYAEDAQNDFAPCTGNINHLFFPKGPHYRLETGIQTGSEVSVFYDAMLAKLITHSKNRSQALRQMSRFLQDTQLFGLTTNLSFLQSVLSHPAVQSGKMHTRLLHEESWKRESSLQIPAFVALLALMHKQRPISHLKGLRAGFRNLPFRPAEQGFEIEGQDITLSYKETRQGDIDCQLDGESHTLSTISHESDGLSFELNHQFWKIKTGWVNDALWVYHPSFGNLKVTPISALKRPESSDNQNPYTSQMPGKILKVLAKPGDPVKENQALLVIESMKMETQILAHADGVISEVFVAENQMVDAGAVFLSVDVSS